MTGGLFDPLGTGRADPVRAFPRPSATAVLAGLALAGLAALLAVSYLRDDGDRGRPVAVSPIDRVQVTPKPPAPPAATPAPAPPAAVPPAPPAARADEEVEIQNGVRVVRPRRAAPAQGGQTLPVPGAAAR